MEKDLTKSQNDYAVFLPSISGFYATFIGKQRFGEYVDYNRVPAGLGDVESLNFLNKQQGAFNYKWALYSAGHANLDTTKHVDKEDMIRNRDRDNTWLLGDSGGFQIAKGIWEGNWADPNCPKAATKRKLVVNWMEEYMDYGMMLDIPTWTFQDPKAAKASGIHSYDDAVKATHINAEYYLKHRRGNFKVLNVLQGSTHTDADSWYEGFKDYCDPAKYPDNHFDGWAMGGQNMCDVHLILRRIVHLIHDGLLQEGIHDVMHFLGTSKLEWAVLLTDIQRAVRKYHNKNFMITYDCASPFLATANGQLYIQTETLDRTKWVYRMVPSIDDKKYASDTRLFKDGVLQDGIFKNFQDSPVSKDILVKDICIYAPGDLNKIGKEGKTSWDSFSYAIQMAHNVWHHINAVQEANRCYDNGIYPAMLVQEKFDRLYFRDVIDAIFSTSDRGKAEAIIEEYSRFWMSIIGTRGATGKKTINAQTQFNALFDDADSVPVAETDTEDLQESKLEELENEQK